MRARLVLLLWRMVYRFGLSAIKGIGVASVEAIVRARQGGKFSSVYDFIGKVEQGAVNRRGLESLICAGAFDSLKPSVTTINLWRAQLFESVKQCFGVWSKIVE